MTRYEYHSIESCLWVLLNVLRNFDDFDEFWQNSVRRLTGLTNRIQWNGKWMVQHTRGYESVSFIESHFVVLWIDDVIILPNVLTSWPFEEVRDRIFRSTDVRVDWMPQEVAGCILLCSELEYVVHSIHIIISPLVLAHFKLTYTKLETVWLQ